MLNITLLVVGIIVSGIIVLFETLFKIIVKGIFAVFHDFFMMRKKY